MKRFIRNPLILAVAGTGIILISAKPNTGAPPLEIGSAKFLRDHDQAMELAKKSEKPVFAFFQEVPG